MAGRAWLAAYLKGAADDGAAILMASHDDELIGAVGARVLPVDVVEDYGSGGGSGEGEPA